MTKQVKCSLFKLGIASGLTLILGIILVAYYHNKNQDKLCTDNCNVLMISVDSLRADHLSLDGYSRATTPNIDALASQASFFNNYYSVSFLTPVSEMAVQTGNYPIVNGLKNFNNILPDNQTTLAQYLHKAGYYNQALISSPEYTTYPTLKTSFSRNFDSYQYDQPSTPDTNQYSRAFPPISSIASSIKSAGDKKSFIWLALGGVHWPYGRYEPNVYAATDYNGRLAGHLLDWSLFKHIYQNKVWPGGGSLTNDDIQYVRDEYDNGVRAFDDYVGQIMAQLKALKIDKKTIVVIESEHGEDLGEHGYFAHYDTLDTQTHTPLMIIDPRNTQAKRINSLVNGVDVLPTILDLVHIAKPNNIDGTSLTPLITGAEPDNRNAIYLERTPLWEEAILDIKQDEAAGGLQNTATTDEDIAIRTTQWKYILRLSKSVEQRINWWQFISGQKLNFPDAELYDLTNDPGEITNVIADHPDVVKTLSSQLVTWYNAEKAKQPAKPINTNQLQPYF